MTLIRKRYCDERDAEIPNNADFIGTEGIYIDGENKGEGIDIVKDEDFCSSVCLCEFVRSKWQEVTVTQGAAQ